jgi:hypothetical protein
LFKSAKKLKFDLKDDDFDDIQPTSMFFEHLPTASSFNASANLPMRASSNYLCSKTLNFEPVDEVMTEED